jgi:hypothetical protein
MATYDEINEVWQLVDELRDLRGTRGLTAPEINKVTITLETEQGNKVIQFVPTDAGWGPLLTRLNTNTVDKIAAIKTRLTNLSITELPE